MSDSRSLTENPADDPRAGAAGDPGAKRGLDPFHLAVPVHDLAAARDFYGGLLACGEGRSSSRWVDFNLYGHQLSCHLQESSKPDHGGPGRADQRVDGNGVDGNRVDGDRVPVPHFGVVLPMDRWRMLADRLADAGVSFILGPRVRFRGRRGEQATFFLRDPSGNVLEFKAMADPESLFAVEDPGLTAPMP